MSPKHAREVVEFRVAAIGLVQPENLGLGIMNEGRLDAEFAYEIAV